MDGIAVVCNWSRSYEMQYATFEVEDNNSRGHHVAGIVLDQEVQE